MKIICPNCSAEYQIDGTFFDSEGRNVQCDQCTQEWYEYNFHKVKTSSNSDQTVLNKLAVEEYQILKSRGTKSNEIKSASELGNDIKFRIQESSDKLEQTKKFTSNKTEKTPATATRANTWTVTGFVTVSIIYAIFSSLYIFNFELQKMLPVFQNSLVAYKIFIDQFATIIQKLYSDTLKGLY